MADPDKPFLTVQTWLAIAIAAGFFANLAAQYFITVPAENKDTLTQLSSTLINVFLLLVGYFFGSSSGSAKKDSTIAYQASIVADKAAPLGQQPVTMVKIEDSEPVKVKETK